MSIRQRMGLGLLAIAFGVVATYATAWIAVGLGPIGTETTTQLKATSDGPMSEELDWPRRIAHTPHKPAKANVYRSWGSRVWSGIHLADQYAEPGEDRAKTDHENSGDRQASIVGDTAKYKLTLVYEVRAGWPVRSVQYLCEHIEEEDTVTYLNEQGGFSLWGSTGSSPQSRSSVKSVLPIRPLWPQFLTNVAIWAFFVSLVGVAFDRVVWNRRSSRRLRHGLCVRCGYDLVGLDSRGGCPECGGAVRAQAEGQLASLDRTPMSSAPLN